MMDCSDPHARLRHGLPCIVAAALLGAHLPALAQVYKWTDAQGTIHYGDNPPPQQQGRASQLGPVPRVEPGLGGAFPYELARAVKMNPVTLYTADRCGACDDGRALLRARGIPYVERTIATNEDKAWLRQLTGELLLPLLVVGNRRIAGFQEAAWQEALNAAAYPHRSQLPPGYRYGAPEPAAPASVPAPADRAGAPPGY